MNNIELIHKVRVHGNYCIQEGIDSNLPSIVESLVKGNGVEKLPISYRIGDWDRVRLALW
jgi:hypothetical protein